jgi:hypothetical protein
MEVLLYDLRWHSNEKTEAELVQALQQFLSLAAANSLQELQQACEQSGSASRETVGLISVSSSNLVRLLRSGNETLVDLASSAISYLSWQGEHSSQFHFEVDGIKLDILMRE